MNSSVKTQAGSMFGLGCGGRKVGALRSFKASVLVGGFLSVFGPSVFAGPVISPFLIGENLWNGDTPKAGANLAWPQMKAAGFKLIRVGGIAYNDKTPPIDRYVQWVDSIKSIGAEPLIQVSSLEAPAVAAELVNQLNIKLKYQIKFWSIGNEPTCGKTADAGTIAGLATNFKDRASAMKKVDPAIKIFVGDECYWRAELYDALIGGAQDITGKDAAGNHFIDVVAFHNYPFPGNNKTNLYTRQQVLETGIAGMRGMLQKCNANATGANTKHARTGANALGCAITEFNITYWNSSGNGTTGVGVRSFLNGQFFAEIFGSGMEYGAFTVAPWSIQESNGDQSGSDLGLFDGSATLVPRPSYYHIKMISQNMTGEFIPSSSDKPGLKTYASKNQDDAAVLILNENENQGYRFKLKFNMATTTASSSASLKVDAGWDGEYLDSIPPQSTLVIKVRKPGLLITKQSYSQDMANKYLPPVVENGTVATRLKSDPGSKVGSFLWLTRFKANGSTKVPIKVLKKVEPNLH